MEQGRVTVVKIIVANDPDEALLKGLEMLEEYGEFETSRGGDVVVMPQPITTIWEKGYSIVSTNPIRDANPFFHFNEALWMLEGRNDVASLDVYIKDFGGRYAESDGVLHGAYGHRWINHFGVDQLQLIVEKLQSNPEDRQCVLQMWDAHTDMGNDLDGMWKDRPCNTHVYFRVHARKELEMTVCCRSNDMIWGAYGANIVQFGVLHRYMAVRIGVEVGRYYQISNNFHAYLDVFVPLSLEIQKTGQPLPMVRIQEDPLFLPYKTFSLVGGGFRDDVPAYALREKMNKIYDMYKARLDIPWQEFDPHESEWLQAAAWWVQRRRSLK